MAKVIVHEVTCRSALSPCGLPGFKYSLNPYRGCQHGCVYCYSPSIIRERRKWGSFVDVRVNMPTVLAKEINRKKRGVIWLGSVCDAYQPAEKRYEITRKCLEQLTKVDLPVSLLTKSSLSCRDFDLMGTFSDFELGYSIICANDSIRSLTEPGASSIEERIGAITQANEKGLDPWAFIAPIMPGITDRPGEIEDLIGKLARAGVRRIGFDPFRPKPGIWSRMNVSLENMPDLAETCRSAIRDPDYFGKVARVIERECGRHGIAVVV